MDICELSTADKHEKGAEVQIKAPDGKETDFYITVMGVDSKEYQRQLKRLRNSYLLMKPDDYSEDEEIKADIERLVSITLGWRGLTNKGKEVEFTKQACTDLYEKAPRVRQQVENFIGDSANFIRG